MNTRIETPEASQKERIMDLLVARATSGDRPNTGAGRQTTHRGWTGIDVLGISKELGISPHDVTHALFDLRARGQVDFQESKRPNSKRSQTISRGGTPSNGSIPVRLRVPLAVLDRLSKEVEQTPSEQTQTVLGVRLPFDLMPAEDRPAAEERWAARQSERAIIDVAAEIGAIGLTARLDDAFDAYTEVRKVRMEEPIPEPILAEPEVIPEPVPTPEPEPLPVVEPEAPVVRLGAFPLVWDLTQRLERNEKARRAVDLLLEAGMEEHAITIDAEVKTLTPLESEVVGLLNLLIERGALRA